MRTYLGIDIGGTKILAVAVRMDGVIVAEVLERTPRTKQALERELSAIIRNVVERHRIAGVGVGVPGPIDKARGTLLCAPHLPLLNGWRALAFMQHFHLPAALANDSQCFLRAEMRWGAGQEHRTAAAFTFGTGIGGALAIDGIIHAGAHHAAGEFGHLLSMGAQTLESLAGKTSTRPRATKGTLIGRGIANVVNMIDPEIIILGGGAVAEGYIDIAAVRRSARRHILSPLARMTPIVPGILGESAQAIGAALLASDPS